MNLENADLSFPELYIWRNVYKPFISMIDDALCIKLEFNGKNILFPPIGMLSFQKAKDDLISYLKNIPGKGLIGGLSKEEAASTGMPYRFDRDNSDYVYAASDLAELPGKKYHAKRNLFRQFEKIYQYEFKPLDCENINGCLALSETWCNIRNCSQDPHLDAEEKAVRETLNNCAAFKLFGGVLTVEGSIIAFTVASELNASMIVVHIEKADTAYKGVYQTINHLFAKTLNNAYPWINRESDIGNEGLRKSKLSYYPARFTEKYFIKV